MNDNVFDITNNDDIKDDYTIHDFKDNLKYYSYELFEIILFIFLIPLVLLALPFIYLYKKIHNKHDDIDIL